ncbi:hypothetical protein PR202_gb14841 [Eleusine coracana subsp. coracana]|uniref:Secreted protein n=1 Tax=Eleusine coracana subsp. coracana TaxID=191504 RepID=A0AAV5EXB3_ELECO|nr:hypothetical protein PR202_gb14841 [Eleusine coracana subsp. coracana]
MVRSGLRVLLGGWFALLVTFAVLRLFGKQVFAAMATDFHASPLWFPRRIMRQRNREDHKRTTLCCQLAGDFPRVCRPFPWSPHASD